MTIFRAILALAGLTAANVASAIPELQLDILGGTYVGGTEESTFANSSIFTVRALFVKKPNEDLLDYYLSAAIHPGPGASVPPPAVGSFVIDGTTYTSATLNFGDPPVNIPDVQPGDLAPHGVFPTYYAEILFNFSLGSTVAAYNTATGDSASGLLYYRDFSVNVTGLLPAYSVHFDLYDEKVKQGNYTVDDFAPFSHDAQSGHQVPDGGSSVLLLGLNLVGFAIAGRLMGGRGWR